MVPLVVLCSLSLVGLITGKASAYSYLRTSIQNFISTKEVDAILQDKGFDAGQWTSYFGGISHAVHACKTEQTCNAGSVA